MRLTGGDRHALKAKRLGVSAEACLAFEDSDNGARAAHSAGLAVIFGQGPSSARPATIDRSVVAKRRSN